LFRLEEISDFVLIVSVLNAIDDAIEVDEILLDFRHFNDLIIFFFLFLVLSNHSINVLLECHIVDSLLVGSNHSIELGPSHGLLSHLHHLSTLELFSLLACEHSSESHLFVVRGGSKTSEVHRIELWLENWLDND